MPERVARQNPLVRVQVEAAVQQVVEQLQVLGLGLAHARRRGQEAGAQVACRLDDGQRFDGGLEGVLVKEQTNYRTKEAPSERRRLRPSRRPGRSTQGCVGGGW